jgi:hypothetical protein
MPCKERLETPRCRLWLYRPCTASFSVGSVKRLGDLAILKTKRKDDLKPYWQDEKDWLCIVEFLPTDDPEARLFAAEIIGYLVGYANLTNTRSLALLGDPDASAYELLFSFSFTGEKNEFLHMVRSNEDMGKGLSFLLSLNTYRRWTNSITAWLTSWARSCWVQ